MSEHHVETLKRSASEIEVADGTSNEVSKTPKAPSSPTKKILAAVFKSESESLGLNKKQANEEDKPAISIKVSRSSKGGSEHCTLIFRVPRPLVREFLQATCSPAEPELATG